MLSNRKTLILTLTLALIAGSLGASTYRLVLQSSHKFFGAMDVDAYGTRVRMAEPEKTIVSASPSGNASSM